ncbi:ACP phosphodiesterase [Aestuariirhabdus sp. LZHN29]|uniref:acyl carrier protein phosphodiesterase n=1 Tax=Aestuariirhabdus sp. LZHN29 TaxID=3417462 RepID=UPI003CF81C06
MNYLAHLALAGALEDHRIGSFLGDFVKGPLRGKYAPAIEAGIRQHRAIDAHTDRDTEITQCRLLLGKEHRRYSGIAVDILFDHLLARHWDRLYNEAFETFCERCYEELQSHQHLMPENAQRFVTRMRAHRILHSYYHRGTVQLALERTAPRVRQGKRLLALLPAIDARYNELDEAFVSIYPKLQRFAAQQLTTAT